MWSGNLTKYKALSGQFSFKVIAALEDSHDDYKYFLNACELNTRTGGARIRERQKLFIAIGRLFRFRTAVLLPVPEKGHPKPELLPRARLARPPGQPVVLAERACSTKRVQL